jgi:hypothetical protein
MAIYHLLAFTNAVAGREAEFNRWYTDRHVPDLLALPGFISAQRFALTNGAGQDQRFSYLAIYEFESDDVNATLAEMRSRAGTAAMPMSEASDQLTFDVMIATPITARLLPKSG